MGQDSKPGTAQANDLFSLLFPVLSQARGRLLDEVVLGTLCWIQEMKGYTGL